MNNRKNHDVRFRCSKQEKEKILKRAEQCNMKIGDYVRYLIKNTNIKVIINA